MEEYPEGACEHGNMPDDCPTCNEDAFCEGDYTTEDHRKFYQYGKLVLNLPDGSDHWAALEAHMEQEKFWPNVWFVSDHGNFHLMTRED